MRPITGISAWIFPGLGHLLLGARWRALAVGGAVWTMAIGGVLVGGIDVIDSKEDRWWFVLQAGVGPAVFSIDALHQRSLKGLSRGELRMPGPGERVVREPDGAGNTRRVIVRDQRGPASMRSLGRANEIGSLYVAAAGLLNVMAIIDCATGGHGRRRRNTTPNNTKASAQTTPAPPGVST